jgi:hypothetical protein
VEHDRRAGHGHSAEITGSTARFPFEETARLLHIPPERWHDPTVRELVGVYNRLHQLQADLRERVMREAVDATHRARYVRTDLILQAALELFQDGFGDYHASRHFVRGKLNRALQPYELHVEDERDPTLTVTDYQVRDDTPSAGSVERLPPPQPRP